MCGLSPDGSAGSRSPLCNPACVTAEGGEKKENKNKISQTPQIGEENFFRFARVCVCARRRGENGERSETESAEAAK